MKGMNYAGLARDVFASRLSDSLIHQLDRIGTNWLAVSPAWYQDTAASGEIHPWQGITPSDESVRHLIGLAHRLGMKVMLKPVVEARDGSWRPDFRADDWDAWFASYQRFVTHYARLAAEEGVEAFSAGDAYSGSDVGRPDDWRRMIVAIRREFKGPVLYGADWDRFRNVRFWDAVDLIGINAYFPLSSKPAPTLDDLKAGWSRWIQDIERWRPRSGFEGKQIVFTEIGYASRKGAAYRPSALAPGAPVDLRLQRDAYEAAFQTVYHRPWLAGLFWFWWDNPSVPDWPGGSGDRGYTPRGKPAEKVLSRWYGQPRPVQAR